MCAWSASSALSASNVSNRDEKRPVPPVSVGALDDQAVLSSEPLVFIFYEGAVSNFPQIILTLTVEDEHQTYRAQDFQKRRVTNVLARFKLDKRSLRNARELLQIVGRVVERLAFQPHRLADLFEVHRVP